MTLELRQAENSVQVVGTTSAELFAAVPTRTYFYVYNGTAGKVLTIRLGDGDAVATQGIVLAYGQAYTQSDGEGFRAWRGRIAAISDAADCYASKQSMISGGV